MRFASAKDIPGKAVPGGVLKVLLSPDNVAARNGVMGILELQPGHRLPADAPYGSHDGEEYSYVVSGRLRVWIEGEEKVLEAGDAAVNPPWGKHWCMAEGTEPAVVVWFVSPPIKL